MKKSFQLILALGCLAAFAFGLVQLFNLRFEVGDMYPRYSSLRSDPLGTMAFLESLQKIPGLSVQRDFRATDQLPEEKDTVYLHLAAWSYEWQWMQSDLFREIQEFTGHGGRLVVTFFPQTRKPYKFEFDDEAKTNSVKSAREKSLKEKPAEKNPQDENSPPPKPKKKKKRADWETIREKWGVETAFMPLEQGDEVYEPARVKNKTDLLLPAELDWHSGVVFSNLSSSWKTIYARGTNAVVIEREFGSGSVVMATDSYFLSNEAMLKDRHADLLAWLIGKNQRIVFDEAHFGIMETTGVATLISKYRLYWLAGGLILLAALFIWKNSASFVPPRADEAQHDFIAGRAASAGFVNLLRRNIKNRNVLNVCFSEWKKMFAQRGQNSAAKLQQVETLLNSQNALSSRERNPVQSYQEICKILKSTNATSTSKLETQPILRSPPIWNRGTEDGNPKPIQ